MKKLHWTKSLAWHSVSCEDYVDYRDGQWVCDECDCDGLVDDLDADSDSEELLD